MSLAARPRLRAVRVVPALRWVVRGLFLGLLAFAIFGPLANLVLWAFAERWYFPHALPLE